jgi:hypothetical protein
MNSYKLRYRSGGVNFEQVFTTQQAAMDEAARLLLHGASVSLVTVLAPNRRELPGGVHGMEIIK